MRYEPAEAVVIRRRLYIKDAVFDRAIGIHPWISGPDKLEGADSLSIGSAYIHRVIPQMQEDMPRSIQFGVLR